MIITNMTSECGVYTCNAWLVVGDFKAFRDVNGLVDAGRCPELLERLSLASTGVGKPAVEKLVITHNHYDHISMIGPVVERFGTRVFAFSKNVPHVTDQLHDGQLLKFGDREFLVLWAPGHSSDSMFLYCQEDGVLFTGDNPYRVSSEDSYDPAFIRALQYLAQRPVRIIYPGHGSPIHVESTMLIGQYAS